MRQGEITINEKLVYEILAYQQNSWPLRSLSELWHREFLKPQRSMVKGNLTFSTLIVSESSFPSRAATFGRFDNHFLFAQRLICTKNLFFNLNIMLQMHFIELQIWWFCISHSCATELANTLCFFYINWSDKCTIADST